MRTATIRINERKEITIEAGGLSPTELATALDAVLNVICEQACGDPLKGQAMKAFCAKQNMSSNSKLVLPPNVQP